jgi:hypothetical protein
MNNQHEMEDLLQLLFDLIPHVTITDHVSGKITIRLDLSLVKNILGSQNQSIKIDIPGITETSFNLFSRSIVIKYDPNLLPFDLWELLREVKEEPNQKPVVQNRLREHFGIHESENQAV